MASAGIAAVDTVIVGAGIIGSALAAGFAEIGFGDVLVIDPDLEGTLSSSELNAGGVRATWNQEINVIASRLSIEYFAKHAADVGYRPVGYLWMHTPERMKELEASVRRWEASGWPVETWTTRELTEKRPFIDQVDDLGGALFAPRDGLVNPNLLKNHFREQARRGGVAFRDRLFLEGAEEDAGGWTLSVRRLPAVIAPEEKQSLLSREGASADADAGGFEKIRAKRVINCAGPWASRIAKILGYESPCYPVRRQISLFDCREVDLTPYGMMIDSSGVYFHPEATYVLSGIAVRDEPRGMNFEYGGEEFFQEKIWLPLAARSSKFERLRHVTGWGGLYEVSPDESAVIGEVARKDGRAGSLYEAHSFSGHGVMHSYAVGRALAEKLVRGRSEFMDLAPLSGSRFAEGKLISETAVI